MKIVYFFIAVVSSLWQITIAYPLDYNESAIEKTDEALTELRLAILQPNFTSILNEFQDHIAPIGLNLYDKISKFHEYYSNKLNSVEENIKNINADISECTETRNLPEFEQLYLQYESECEEVTTDLGKKVISFGYSKRIVFLDKYEKLMHYYKGCITPGDPIPKICEGVISATMDQVRRIFPIAKSYSFETERYLKQEVMDLSECANRKISDYSRRVQKEFGKILNCILSKVNEV